MIKNKTFELESASGDILQVYRNSTNRILFLFGRINGGARHYALTKPELSELISFLQEENTKIF